MVATLALTEFEALYTLQDVAAYAERKDAIFARYRTAAEASRAWERGVRGAPPLPEHRPV